MAYNPMTGRFEPDMAPRIGLALPAFTQLRQPAVQPQPGMGLLNKQPEAEQTGFDPEGAMRNIYGAGGPGDALVALGAGLMTGRNVGQGLLQGLQTVQSQQGLANQREMMNARLKAAQAKANQPDYGFGTNPQGQTFSYDKNNPNAGINILPGQPSPQPIKWGSKPEGADLYYDEKGMPHSLGTPTTNINIDQKQGTKFAEKSGEAIASRFANIAQEGDTAREDMALVDELNRLGTVVGTGPMTAFRGYLANKGVKVGDNIGEIEAMGALIDKMTPAQRAPGSGSSTDKDASLFKSSLPSLIREPEGNAIIQSTLAGLADYKIKRATIAEQAQLGEITPQDAMKQLRELPSPYAAFKEFREGKYKPIPVGGSRIIDGVPIVRKR